MLLLLLLLPSLWLLPRTLHLLRLELDLPMLLLLLLLLPLLQLHGFLCMRMLPA
jgi:hypothetical protein